MKARIFSW